MFRTLDIIMIGALIAGAAWTFKVKYDSEVAKEHLAKLEKRLQIEREAIDILHADWSLLTSPDRLEKLVERYHDDLQLDQASPEQIGTFDQVPQRAVAPGGDQPRQKSAEGAHPDTGIITGTVPVPSTRPSVTIDGDPAELE